MCPAESCPGCENRWMDGCCIHVKAMWVWQSYCMCSINIREQEISIEEREPQWLHNIICWCFGSYRWFTVFCVCVCVFWGSPPGPLARSGGAWEVDWKWGFPVETSRKCCRHKTKVCSWNTSLIDLQTSRLEKGELGLFEMLFFIAVIYRRTILLNTGCCRYLQSGEQSERARRSGQ